MSIIGTLHEFSLYGLLTTIFCLIKKVVSFESLRHAALHVSNFSSLFQCYLFWASILFIPIAIIGAFSTKYGDYGEGLSFTSDNLLVIAFAHIAEDILGLVCSPFWFLRDLFTHNLNIEKVVGYIIYVLELVFIACGLISLFG